MRIKQFARTAISLVAGLLSAVAGQGSTSRTLQVPPSASVAADSIPIFMQFTPATLRAGVPFWLEVHIGSPARPADSLFGASFELKYDLPQYIDIVAPKPDSLMLLPGELLGDDVIFLAVPDDSAGSISVGITRKAGAENVSGYGAVFRARLIARRDLPDSTQLRFWFTRYQAQDKDGNSIPLTPRSTQALIIHPESFTVEITPTWQRQAVGRAAGYQVSLRPAGGFDREASLRATPDLPGIRATFSKQQIRPGEVSLLTLATDSAATAGNFVFTVHAEADSLSSTAACTLAVFTVPLAPTSSRNPVLTQTPFAIEIDVGASDRPVTDLALLAFVLSHDHSEFVQFAKSDSLAPRVGQFLGQGATIQVNDRAENNRLFVRLQAAANTAVSGFGRVATLWFTSALETPDSTQVTFRIDSVDARDAGGRPVVLAPEEYVLTLREKRLAVLQVTPDTLAVAAGATATYQLDLRASASFNEGMALSVNHLPAGATAAFQPVAIFKNQTALARVATDTSVVPGTYRLEFAGEGGGLRATAGAILQVLPAPSFLLHIRPEVQAILPGDSAAFEISVEVTQALKSPVQLEIRNLQDLAWLQFELTRSEIDMQTAAQILLVTTDQAPPGTYDFFVLGRSEGATRSATATLSILEPPPPVRPNPFTPNNDGYNDVVIFDFPEFKTQPGEVLIFDAQGRKVIDLRGKMRWDGRNENGDLARPGAYLYIVRIDNRVIARGVLGLAR